MRATNYRIDLTDLSTVVYKFDNELSTEVSSD